MVWICVFAASCPTYLFHDFFLSISSIFQSIFSFSLSLFSLSFAPPSSFSFSSYQFISLSSFYFFLLSLLSSFLCPITNVTNLNPSLLQVPECGSESEPKTGFFIQSLIPVSFSLFLPSAFSLSLSCFNSHFLLFSFSILLSISFLTFPIFSLLTLLVSSNTFILHPPLLSNPHWVECRHYTIRMCKKRTLRYPG